MVSPQITGHTGNDQTADNSLDSVYRSIELKADAFELDVRMDKNRNLVLSHNELEQEGYDSCPRLASVFEIMKTEPDIRINCDLKAGGLPLEVIRLAESFGIGADRLILTGLVDLAYLDSHPEVLQMADVFMNAENILETVFFELTAGTELSVTRDDYYRNPWRNLRAVLDGIEPYVGLLSDTCREYRVKGINLPFLSVTDDNLRHFRNAGVPVSVWTVNEEPEIQRLLSGGVDNLTTRRVSAAKSIRKKLFGF